MRLLAAYFFWNATRLFALILGMISMLLAFRMVFGLIPLLENLNLSLLQLLYLIVLNIPSILTVALPLAFSIAVFFSVRETSMQNEMVALQSLGVSLQVCLQPLVIMAAIFSVVVAIFSYQVNPSLFSSFQGYQYQLSQRFRKLALAEKSVNVVANSVIYFDQEKKSGEYQNFFVVPVEAPRKDASSSSDRIIIADKAKVDLSIEDLRLNIGLEKGLMYNFAGSTSQRFKFASSNIGVQKSEQLQSDIARFNQETLDKLAAYDQPTILAMPLTILNLRQLWIVKNAPVEGTHTELSQREAAVEIYDRLLYGLCMIPFAFIGFSLGIQNPRFPQKGGVFLLLVLFLGYFQLYGYVKKSLLGYNLPIFSMFLPWIVWLAMGYVFYRFAKVNKKIL